MGTVQNFGTVRIAGTDIDYTPAVRAGNWLFITGLEASDLDSGLAAEVAPHSRLPNHGTHHLRRQADYVFGKIDRLLGQAGSSRDRVVRIDQYYLTPEAVDPYHQARKVFFSDVVPPSTSVLMERLLVDDSAANVSLIAMSSKAEIELVHPAEVAPAPRASAFVPAIVAEDLVFVAGQIANTPEWGLDPRAHVPDHAAWGGTEIRKQAAFIIKERIEPILSAAGCTLSDMVKVQVYLARAADIPDFLDVWGLFVRVPCALTIALTRGYALIGAICEINVIALRSIGRAKKQIVTADIPASMSFGQPAVKAGGFIFLPGLMAVNEAGVSPRVAALSGLSQLGAPAAMEATILMEAATALCKAARASIDDAVRFNLFLADLRDVAPVCRTIQGAIGGRPIPFSAVRMPGPPPVPGCRVVADIWVRAP